LPADEIPGRANLASAVAVANPAGAQ
jgi:hypothetical protein